MHKLKAAMLTALSISVVGILPAGAKPKSAGKFKPAFDKGTKSISAFLGIGVNYDDYHDYAYPGYKGYSRSFTPSIGVTYDQGIWGNAGPGTIGIGGVIAYKHSTLSSLGNKDFASSFVLGVRGTYHLTLLSNKVPRLDPYGGITLGFRFTHYRTNYDNTSGHEAVPIAGLFAGASYAVAPNFGAFGELGYDISIFRAGITIHL